MDQIAFDNPERLRWLLLVAGCAALVVYGMARRAAALKAFATEPLAEMLAPDVSRFRQWVKALCMIAAMGAIVAALLGPRWGDYWEPVHRRRLDLMICLDVSRSMLAEDAGMSRLDRAKDDIKQLLDRLQGGTIGLVTFAGRAQLTTPLTDDYDFYRIVLDEVGIHSAPRGGTNLAQGIAEAVRAVRDRPQNNRAIVLLTDGEYHEGEAAEAARHAHEEGIPVYAIGIGDDKQGALIPIEKEGRTQFLMDGDQQVWTKLSPAELRAVASAGGGEYYPSGLVANGQRSLEWLYLNKLAPLEERSVEERQVRKQYARFHWPAAAALALLVLEPLIRERRRRGEMG